MSPLLVESQGIGCILSATHCNNTQEMLLEKLHLCPRQVYTKVLVSRKTVFDIDCYFHKQVRHSKSFFPGNDENCPETQVPRHSQGPALQAGLSEGSRCTVLFCTALRNNGIFAESTSRSRWWSVSVFIRPTSGDKAKPVVQN